MAGANDPIAELESRLERYPEDRYPVQHATGRFQLGLALAEAGQLERAEVALAIAARLFHPTHLAAEHGKALNALGAVLRMAARHEEAAAVLVRAAAALQRAGLPAEEGAARFNLGLVQREAGEPAAAAEALHHAHRLFAAANAPGHAAAAARELGAAHFAAGELDAAREVLQEGLVTAGRAGDDAGAGAAANVLGLVELAAGRPEAATDRFTTAAAAHPRRLRPADHAMAKANLALAHERTGDALRARLAARQALGVPAAPAPVRAQAQAVLTRLADAPDDLVAVLEPEPPERRERIMREELARWADADDGERRAEAGRWIEGQVARPEGAVGLAQVLVGGLLELPPDDMEAVISGIVRALSERPSDVQDEFRAQVAMASARFHVPQLMRLRDTFNRIATDHGQAPAWR